MVSEGLLPKWPVSQWTLFREWVTVASGFSFLAAALTGLLGHSRQNACHLVAGPTRFRFASHKVKVIVLCGNSTLWRDIGGKKDEEWLLYLWLVKVFTYDTMSYTCMARETFLVSFFPPLYFKVVRLRSPVAGHTVKWVFLSLFFHHKTLVYAGKNRKRPLVLVTQNTLLTCACLVRNGFNRF